METEITEISVSEVTFKHKTYFLALISLRIPNQPKSLSNRDVNVAISGF